MTPKVPARVIHTSIRVPVTAEEYASIKRAAKLRGAPSLAAWLRERGASHAFADGIEGLATAEARLEAAERERGELRAEVVTLRADLEEWRRSHREAESLADQAKRRRERTLETVEARADAAEAKLAAIDAPFLGGALHHIEMLHADQRESRDREEALVLKLDAAEAKLAALVEAADFLGPTWPSELVAWMGRGGKPDEATRAAVAGLQDLHAALRAVKGPGVEWASKPRTLSKGATAHAFVAGADVSACGRMSALKALAPRLPFDTLCHACLVKVDRAARGEP